ncbi:MAG: hypothetical protein BAA04_04805 [Firmicutes bacterium ZCTH02-B6]|nr:MAG: hypothetical protein BAA04_04805 [Firmicutes bacterium ZCTH02-B6]
MRDLFRFNLQLFAADGAGGGDSNAGSDGGQGDGDQGTAGGQKIQFTPEQQAYIDALIAQRLSRAEKTAAKRALEARAKELGFESVEAMEAALKAAKEAQEAQKSETEKLREAKEAAERQARAAQEQAKQALIRAALMTAAAQAGFADPQDAIRLADTSEVDVKDDGTVTGAIEAIEALAKAKPYLLRSAGSQGVVGGGNPVRGHQLGDDPAERGRQMALQRNQQQRAQAASGFDPWTQGGAGSIDVNNIAQAVAAAVAAALGQGNR